MKVEAARDDGALLVTDGPAAAVVLGDRVWLCSRASALSKGVLWFKANDTQVPQRLRVRLGQDLARLRQELDSNDM